MGDHTEAADLHARLDATSRLYVALRRDVLDGVFPAGAPLQEVALTSRYGNSRTPVREALARLAQDGLLERVGRGYRVRSGTAEDVLDIYEARIALEAVAAAGAATRCTQLELVRLDRLRLAAAESDDLDEERRLNAQWHEELWLAGHSPTVRDLLVRITAQLRIYDHGRVESPTDLRESRAEHAAVMAALRRRDSGAAAAAIRGHLERSRDLRLDAFAEVSAEAGGTPGA